MTNTEDKWVETVSDVFYHIDSGLSPGETADMLSMPFEIVEFILDNEDRTEFAHVEDNFTDVEADADTLASAGMGTDEDYFHNEDDGW